MLSTFDTHGHSQIPHAVLQDTGFEPILDHHECHLLSNVFLPVHMVEDCLPSNPSLHLQRIRFRKYMATLKLKRNADHIATRTGHSDTTPCSVARNRV